VPALAVADPHGQIRNERRPARAAPPAANRIVGVCEPGNGLGSRNDRGKRRTGRGDAGERRRVDVLRFAALTGAGSQRRERNVGPYIAIEIATIVVEIEIGICDALRARCAHVGAPIVVVVAGCAHVGAPVIVVGAGHAHVGGARASCAHVGTRIGCAGGLRIRAGRDGGEERDDSHHDQRREVTRVCQVSWWAGVNPSECRARRPTGLVA